MTVKDLKDAMLEYVKSDPTWDTMDDNFQNSLQFLLPVLSLGLFGEIITKPEDTEITLVDLIDSLVDLKAVTLKNNKKN